MSTRQILISLILVVLIVTTTCISYKTITEKKESKNYSADEKLISVKVSEPIDNGSKVQIEEYGYAKSIQTVELIAEGNGKLLTTPTKLAEGITFKKGQLLVKIDSEIKRHKLNALKSDYKTLITSTLPDIKIDYPQEFSTWKQYSDKISQNLSLLPPPISSNQVFNSFIAQQGLLKQYNLIQSDEASINKHYIYAPFNGSFISIDLQESSNVTAGKKIGTIIRTDQLEIAIPLNSELISQLKTGLLVELIKGKNIKVNGVISRISDFTSQETQTQQVYILIKDAYKKGVYSGDYISVRIPLKRDSDLYKIPQSSIFNGNKVFVVNPIDSTINLKNIVTKDIIGSHSLVTGLNSSDLIIINTNSSLHKGMKVSYNKIQ